MGMSFPSGVDDSGVNVELVEAADEQVAPQSSEAGTLPQRNKTVMRPRNGPTAPTIHSRGWT